MPQIEALCISVEKTAKANVIFAARGSQVFVSKSEHRIDLEIGRDTLFVKSQLLRKGSIRNLARHGERLASLG
jgi:hypothetical protein